MNKPVNTKKKVRITGIVLILLLAVTGILLYILLNDAQSRNDSGADTKGNTAEKNEQDAEKENYYLSMSASDRETADLYAELYEMTKEDVAKQQEKTGDWEETAKELERMYFTIPENSKYQMEKEGYALEDLQEAERLSVKTGRKAIELAKAKGTAADNREWSDVVKDSEILSTEEQLGLTKEQVRTLEDMGLEKEERVEAAILLLNEEYTFDEIVRELNSGKIPVY